jgi:hypothetical protein
MYKLPIPASVKRAVKKMLPPAIWLKAKDVQRQMAFRGSGPYSFDENAILKYIEKEHPECLFYVDIGAQDGVLGSQTLALAKRGWAGVAYEADPEIAESMKRTYSSLPTVNVRTNLVTPDNICDLLRNDNVPANFGFLSLDIDSFDYFILESVLGEFSPTVICVEINELIPPPILFSVVYKESNFWSGDSFQGFSIQMIHNLCNAFGYDIGELHYNNLLLVKRPGAITTASNIADAYRAGYLLRHDRAIHFPWNEPHKEIWSADPEDALQTLREMFQDRLDDCILELDTEL